MELVDAHRYVASVRWQFAASMPRWPHEYTHRHWDHAREHQFVALVELIRTRGVVKPWPYGASRPRYRHTYLTLGPWEYWTMGAPLEETIIINRARVEHQQRPAAERPPQTPWQELPLFP